MVLPIQPLLQESRGGMKGRSPITVLVSVISVSRASKKPQLSFSVERETTSPLIRAIKV